MYSVQRRRDRYRIIYIWKVLEDLVPRVNNIASKDHIRLGRMCVVPRIDGKTLKYREASLAFQGARLFNCLPKHIRDLRHVPLEKFKNALDTYLAKVPDEPLIVGYTASKRTSSNCLYDMVKFSGCSGYSSL